MSTFIKVNGNWTAPFSLYKKEGENWIQLTESAFRNYLSHHSSFYGGHINNQGQHFLQIVGAVRITGESCSYSAIYDSNQNVTSAATWSIASGDTFATIDSQTGEITILSGASGSSVTIRALYSGVTAVKNITLTFEAGTTSETETEIITNDSGETTTTTTTTTTDSSGRIVTETEISVVDESGNSMGSQTSVVTENPDGSYTGQTMVYDENGDLTHTVTESETILTDESGTPIGSQTSVMTENPDGTYSGQTMVYDEEGNLEQSTTSSAVIVTDESGTPIGTQTNVLTENSDGSSTGQTRNYDENGTLTDGENTSGDTEGNVSTQNVEYDSEGTATVVGFDIDTSSNTGGTKDIEGNGIDTEFVPFKFANDGFVVHIKFRTVASEQPRPPITPDTEDSSTNYLYTVLGAKTAAKIGNIWPGFEISWAIAKNGTGTSGTLQIKRTFSGETSSAKYTFTSSDYSGDNIYDITFTYNPNITNKFIVYNNITETTIWSVNKKIQDNVDLDMTIGYSIDHNGDAIRHSNVQIYDFTVNKL